MLREKSLGVVAKRSPLEHTDHGPIAGSFASPPGATGSGFPAAWTWRNRVRSWRRITMPLPFWPGPIV